MAGRDIVEMSLRELKRLKAAWVKARPTDVIERAFMEVRRRTRPKRAPSTTTRASRGPSMPCWAA